MARIIKKPINDTLENVAFWEVLLEDILIFKVKWIKKKKKSDFCFAKFFSGSR